MSSDFQVTGKNNAALFKLKVHRGDGMALVAMNWKKGQPPNDFVGFAIEYKEPGGTKFFALKNRIAFPGALGALNPNRLSSRLSPIQKFRWVHFPRNAEMKGDFVYRVSPVFMNSLDEMSYGEAQEAAIELRRETYPGKLNVTFTRGFVSSQAFVDKYGPAKEISTLLPKSAKKGLDFVPSHPKAKEALAWMGFEARSAILEVLDEAINDQTAQVRVVAYDLSEPDVVSRLEKLGKRVKVIIDDSAEHGKDDSGETQSEKRLAISAGAENVKRQKMGRLQHNKTIAVSGKVNKVVCGSTNFTWRGFFVQANNALILRGKKAAKVFFDAFEHYWDNDDVKGFGGTASANFVDLGMGGINIQVGFSPYAQKNSQLKKVADDISAQTASSLFYSLAFLHQTPGVIQDAIEKVTNDPNILSMEFPIGRSAVSKFKNPTVMSRRFFLKP